MKSFHYIVFVALLVACSNPKDTKVPASLTQMDALKPKLERLSQEDRELFAGYVMRHTMGSALGGALGLKSDPIAENITIGGAIEQQRNFIQVQKQEEAQRVALKADREKVLGAMRQAALVTLVSKKIQKESGYSGRILDEKLVVTIGFKNTGSKDIDGIKGTLNFTDIFGDELTGVRFSYDETLKAGASGTWSGSRSIKYGLNTNGDRKFADLPDEKFKSVWVPDTIVFTDGSKLEAQKSPD